MASITPVKKTGLSRWSLRFADPKNENLYLGFEVSEEMLPVRIIMAGVGFLCLTIRLLMSFAGLPMTLSGLILLGTGLFLSGIAAATYVPFVIKHRRIVTLVSAIIVGIMLSVMMLSYSSAVSDLLYPVAIIYMMIISLVNLLWLQKLGLNVAAFLASMVWLHYDSHLDSAGMRIVTNLDLFGLMVSLGVAYTLEISRRRRFLAQLTTEAAQARSEEILHNVLPVSVAQRLIASMPGDRIVDHAENVAVVFADLVGFTAFAATHTPAEVVNTLDLLFGRFDVVCAQHRMEKIKTIGDAYMAIGGLPLPIDRSAHHACEMALDMIACVARLKVLGAISFQIRVGVHVGPVVAGVIGRQRFLYDLWGDTVNVASRLEATSEPNKIHVSKEVADLVRDSYQINERGLVELKGRGKVTTFFLSAMQIPAAM